MRLVRRFWSLGEGIGTQQNHRPHKSAQKGRFARLKMLREGLEGREVSRKGEGRAGRRRVENWSAFPSHILPQCHLVCLLCWFYRSSTIYTSETLLRALSRRRISLSCIS